jgi:hypothetical protein
MANVKPFSMTRTIGDEWSKGITILYSTGILKSHSTNPEMENKYIHKRSSIALSQTGGVS